jgi:hypothetical protein
MSASLDFSSARLPRAFSFEALRSGETPLVGRDEEIELLRRRWEQAKNGEGRMVRISGEPGIGKSRLMAAVSAHIEKRAAYPAALFLLAAPPDRCGVGVTCTVLRLKSPARIRNTDSNSPYLDR